MNCPACSNHKLDPVTLGDDLSARHCSSCRGHWIDSSNYEHWLKRQEDKPESLPETEGFDAPSETAEKAHLCPTCQTFMIKAKVGLGLSYLVDRCVSCQSLWLDASEWESLKSRNLHDEIYFMYSTVWREKQKRHNADQ